MKTFDFTRLALLEEQLSTLKNLRGSFYLGRLIIHADLSISATDIMTGCSSGLISKKELGRLYQDVPSCSIYVYTNEELKFLVEQFAIDACREELDKTNTIMQTMKKRDPQYPALKEKKANT
jgi:hypothetical protein